MTLRIRGLQDDDLFQFGERGIDREEQDDRTRDHRDDPDEPPRRMVE